MRTFTINDLEVEIKIHQSGYFVARTKNRFLSYHRVIMGKNGLHPWMIFSHGTGEYQKRRLERDEIFGVMGERFFDAHRRAVSRYFRGFRHSSRQRLFEQARDHWVPDEIREAEETKRRIVLHYSGYLFFFQRRSDIPEDKEEAKEKGPTKYVSFCLDEKWKGPVIVPDVTPENLAKMKHFADIWADFFPNPPPKEKKTKKKAKKRVRRK